MKDHEMIFGMALDLPPSSHLDPSSVLDLDLALRRALIELEACAAARRAHADRIRSRWRGRRRAEFEGASADLDAATRTALGELQALRKITATIVASDR
jgi:hypothetical protein